MSNAVKAPVTVLVSTVATLGASSLLLGAGLLPGMPLVVAAGVVGLLYGLEAGLLTSYDLGRVKGWAELVVDVTWSLPSTALGFVVGNVVYPFFGRPSRAASAGQGWVVYVPRRSSGFGVDVLQTLGTINIGGNGQHERMHLLQARLLGPAYIPVVVASYVVTGTVQVVWTLTVGGVLWLARVRAKPYLSPPPASAVGGFVGWIYYATPLELWAYARGNP